jgi:hypothetical protein
LLINVYYDCSAFALLIRVVVLIIILDKLEQKKVIVKKKSGKTNKVFLVDELLDALL